MVRVSVVGDRVHFDVEGWDKLWALKSHLDVPIAHIRAVRVDPDAATGWWHGLRLPGTQIPGVITAGTFYQSAGAVFYDVHDLGRTIVRELDHEHYKRLVSEGGDPRANATQLQATRAPGHHLELSPRST